MARRGTEIRLAPNVAARGGLHVILIEFHEAARIDGRAGRRDDPGSYEAIVALDDELFTWFAGRLAGALSAFATPKGVVSRPLGAALRRLAQGSAIVRSRSASACAVLAICNRNSLGGVRPTPLESVRRQYSTRFANASSCLAAVVHHLSVPWARHTYNT